MDGEEFVTPYVPTKPECSCSFSLLQQVSETGYNETTSNIDRQTVQLGGETKIAAIRDRCTYKLACKLRYQQARFGVCKTGTERDQKQQ